MYQKSHWRLEKEAEKRMFWASVIFGGMMLLSLLAILTFTPTHSDLTDSHAIESSYL